MRLLRYLRNEHETDMLGAEYLPIEILSIPKQSTILGQTKSE